MIDQETVRRLFSYDAASGILTWNVRSREDAASEWACNIWNQRNAGKVAGWLSPDGYQRLHVFGKQYVAHRIVWLHVYGELPEAIDHINGVRHDNRLVNLRAVTVTENNRNAKRRSTNASGRTGVSWEQSRKDWVAYIGRTKLGRFKSKHQAILAREAAEREFNFHINHGRSA